MGKIAGNHISEGDILAFLKNIDGNEHIIVKKFKTLGLNSAFSIGLPNDETYKEVFCESFWPKGVPLREFSFNKNFFRRNRENLNSLFHLEISMSASQQITSVLFFKMFDLWVQL